MKTSNMDYEKKYKEALEKIRSLHREYNQISTLIDVKEELENIFPELKESKDKKIREAIYNCVRWFGYGSCFFKYVSQEECFAWLEKQGEQPKKNDVCNNCDQQGSCVSPCPMKLVEKQGEQKPAEWGEDDKKMFSAIWNSLDMECLTANGVTCEKALDWLNSLKDRVQPQPKQEWSEEDEKILKDIITDVKFEGYNNDMQANSYKKINWLKSLRPQNWTKEDKERYISCLQKLGTGNPEQPETINSKWFKEHVYSQPSWKPSKKQMVALEHFIVYHNGSTNYAKDLEELRLQLKKLREE